MTTQFPMTKGRIAAFIALGVGFIIVIVRLVSGLLSSTTQPAPVDVFNLDQSGQPAVLSIADPYAPASMPAKEITISMEARELLSLSRQTILNKARERNFEAQASLNAATQKLKTPATQPIEPPSYGGGFSALPPEAITDNEPREKKLTEIERITVEAVMGAGNNRRAFILHDGSLVPVVGGDQLGDILVVAVGSNFVKLRSDSNNVTRTVFVASAGR